MTTKFKKNIPEKYHKYIGIAKMVLTIICILAFYLIPSFIIDKILLSVFHGTFSRRLIYSAALPPFVFIFIVLAAFIIMEIMESKETDHLMWFNMTVREIIQMLGKDIFELFISVRDFRRLIHPSYLLTSIYTFLISYVADFSIAYALEGSDLVYKCFPDNTFINIFMFIVVCVFILLVIILMFVTAGFVFIKTYSWFEKYFAKKQN